MKIRRIAAAPPTLDRTLAYRHLKNPFEPQRIFSDDQVAGLHEGALQIVENQGVKVLSADARLRYAAGGASVDESSLLVRIDRGLVAEALASAPRQATLHAVDPDRSMLLGERSVVLAAASGAPNIMDARHGRRPGTFEDFCNGLKLCQSFEVIHALGEIAEPQEVAVNIRHLQMTRAQLTLSDKIPHVYSRGHGQVADAFELIRIAHGISEEEFRARPYTYTIINTNSPLQLDIPMADGIIDFALAGQVQMITPFTLAGAMAPVTLAGALTLAHAEVLAGLVLAQIARKGAPVIYGSFTSNVDMKSGSPAFGTPEYVKASFGAGQLARHVGLPWRSSNATASNAPDAQSAYEAQMSLWGAFMGGCNFMLHAAGWMESGLSSSYEKFILDVEMLQMMAEVFQPVGAEAADLTVESVAELGPRYTPLVSDGRNFDTWTADGAKSASARALEVLDRTLRSYQAPPRDPAILEALDDYVERRTAAGGAPPAG